MKTLILVTSIACGFCIGLAFSQVISEHPNILHVLFNLFSSGALLYNAIIYMKRLKEKE